MPEPQGEKVQRGVRERLDVVRTSTRREEEWKDMALALGEAWSGLIMWFGREGLGLPASYVAWLKEGPETRIWATLSALERSQSMIFVPGATDPLPPPPHAGG